MRDPLDTLKGIGASRPTETWPDVDPEPVSAWTEAPGPSWTDQRPLPWDLRLRQSLRGRRSWLPLAALGVIALVGVIATTPEALAERAPAPTVRQNIHVVPVVKPLPAKR